jgi:hypothetical protein
LGRTFPARPVRESAFLVASDHLVRAIVALRRQLGNLHRKLFRLPLRRPQRLSCGSRFGTSHAAIVTLRRQLRCLFLADFFPQSIAPLLLTPLGSHDRMQR